MPNFIIPVVGNPAGGYLDGDQVTATNLNAHIQDAIPTPDFIAGLTDATGQGADPNDYYMKVDKNGYLVKVAATDVGTIPNTVTTLGVNTPLVRSPIPDSVFDQWDSLSIQSGNHITIQSNYTGLQTNNWSTINMTGNVSISTGIGNVSIDAGTSFLVNGVNKWPKFNVNRDVEIDSGNLKVRGGPYASDGGSGFIQIPRGPTSSRPNTEDVYPNGYPLGSSVSGVMRFNTTTNDLEWIDTTQADNWNSVKRVNTAVTYTKQLTLPTFALNVVLWQTPSEIVVPEGEVWIYELNFQFNAGNFGGNTRPEQVFTTSMLLGSIEKVQMAHWTGAYGGSLSSATATVAVTREDTYANGVAYPKRVSWKVTTVGRFGPYTEAPHAYGYIKLTKVKTAAQGTIPQL